MSGLEAGFIVLIILLLCLPLMYFRNKEWKETSGYNRGLERIRENKRLYNAHRAKAFAASRGKKNE